MHLTKTQNILLFSCIFIFATYISIAQEGVISSVYIAERNALQKMYEARKAGDENEVKRLSTEITELVNHRKSQARDMLVLTKSSIEKLQKDNSPTLTNEKRERLQDKIEDLKIQHRLSNLSLEQNTLSYYIEVNNKRNFISNMEKEIEKIKQFAQERIDYHKEQMQIHKDALKAMLETHENDYERYAQILDNYTSQYEAELNYHNENKGDPTKVNNLRTAVENVTKDLANLRSEIDSGTYISHGTFSDSNSLRNRIKYHEDRIEHYKNKLADGTLEHDYGRISINHCLEVIERTNNEIKALRDKYTAEEWQNRKHIRQNAQNIHIRILQLQEQVGLRDEKIAALEARREELKKFIYHDFITEIPSDESSFVKAIRWLTQAIEKVQEVASKFERIKTVTNIIKSSSNPAQPISFLLKEFTGKDLAETIAEKVLPEKILNNSLVQRFVKGESINRNDIINEAIKQGFVGADVKRIRESYDLINSLRSNNIRDLISQRGFEHAMLIIDSNPELKSAWQTFERAHKIMHHPQLLELQLKDKIKQQVVLELKAAGEHLEETQIYKTVEKRLKEYDNQINNIVNSAKQSVQDFEQNITESALISYKTSIQKRIGITDEAKSGIEALINFFPN